MKVCNRCGALYLARFQRITVYESRTVVLEPKHCSCVSPDSPEPQGWLRDLTDVERTHLHDFITRYP